MKQEHKTNLPSDKTEQEYWGSSAKYYDQAYEADTKLNDMPFYLEVARSVNGSVALGALTYTITPATSFTITSVQMAAPAVTEATDVSILEYVIVRHV